MYKKYFTGWMKHWDFVLLDLLTLDLVYLMCVFVRFGSEYSMIDDIYRIMFALIPVLDFLIIMFMSAHSEILKRGYITEFVKVLQNTSVLTIGILLILFLVHSISSVSRIVLVYFWISSTIILWMFRSFLKRWLRYRKARKGALPQLMLVTESRYLKTTLLHLGTISRNRYQLCAIVLLDYDPSQKYDVHLPKFVKPSVFIGNMDKVSAFVVKHPLDEVIIHVHNFEKARELSERFYTNGTVVHLDLSDIMNQFPHAFVESYSGMTMITVSHNQTSEFSLMLKRGMDILGGLCGTVLLGILILIFGPIIYFQSPGPIFFKQVRIGARGRRFYLYKFRSMYPNADAMKAKLMEENKMEGFMFKMDDDPRIIPIGKFMRKYSLDEFPQFINILKGDMSLVGTRPPTVDEWEQYEPHHRARLSFRPGLTGMWQISGRSNITDFEEVVQLDMEYIHSWNILLDIKILLKTVWTVVKGDGSV